MIDFFHDPAVMPRRFIANMPIAMFCVLPVLRGRASAPRRGARGLIPYPYFVIALRRYYENGWVLTVAKSVGVAMLNSMVLIPATAISVFVTG